MALFRAACRRSSAVRGKRFPLHSVHTRIRVCLWAPRSSRQSASKTAHALEPAVPEAEGAVGALTSRFVEARYSRHPVAAEDVTEAAADAQAIAQALVERQARQSAEETGEEER